MSGNARVGTPGRRGGRDGRRNRPSEILASADKSSSSLTDVTDTTNVEDYDEFADRLNNVSDQAISEESSAGSSTDSSEHPEDKSALEQITLVMFTVIVPIALGLIYYGTFEEPSINLSALGQPQYNKEGKAPIINEKRVGDWRDDLKEKGSHYKVLNEDDIKYIKNGPMYLVVAGHVFDVSSGGKMYEEDSGYHGFIGKDGTRAFVTGKFDKEGLSPDLEGLTPEDYKAVSGWINFYMYHDKYRFVGILSGWFFDDMGDPTKNLVELIKNTEIAEKMEAAKLKVEEKFPTCNIEWAAETGSRVWCSASSGGVQRTWVGVPRVFTDEGDKGPRCACVHPDDLKDPRVKEYKGCSAKSPECKIKD